MAKYKVGVYAHYDPNAWEKEKHVSLKRQLRTIHSYLEKDPELVIVKEYPDESTGNEDGIFENLVAIMLSLSMSFCISSAVSSMSLASSLPYLIISIHASILLRGVPS